MAVERATNSAIATRIDFEILLLKPIRLRKDYYLPINLYISI
jgi:hypothetical protein